MLPLDIKVQIGRSFFERKISSLPAGDKVYTLEQKKDVYLKIGILINVILLSLIALKMSYQVWVMILRKKISSLPNIQVLYIYLNYLRIILIIILFNEFILI